MSDAVGKTIARIEEQPTSLEYGYAQSGVLLVHFTDGTALRIDGHSYEEVDLSHTTISRDEARAYARAAAGRRETERLERLRREELESVSAEERARREELRRSKMGVFALAVEDAMREYVATIREDFSRNLFGTGAINIPHSAFSTQKKRKARRN